MNKKKLFLIFLRKKKEELPSYQ